MSFRQAGMVLVTAAALGACALAAEKPLELKSADQKLVAPLNVAALNRLVSVALSGTPSKQGGFVYAFDRRLDTEYAAKDAGEARMDLSFAKPQTLHSIRLLLGEATGSAEWTVYAADSFVELEGERGTYREVVGAGQRLAVGGWEEAKLAAPLTTKALRIRIKPADPKRLVVIRECNLLGEQRLEAVGVKAASGVVQIGRQTPLEAWGYFSGGEERLITGKAVTWLVQPERAARMAQHSRVVGLRRGPIQVNVQVDKYVSPPLGLEVIEAD